METIQMDLSQKQDFFSEFFCCVFPVRIKFRTFSKKDDPQGLCISEITDDERGPWINV